MLTLYQSPPLSADHDRNAESAVFAVQDAGPIKDIDARGYSDEIEPCRRNVEGGVLVYDDDFMSAVLDYASYRKKPEMRSHPRL